MAVTTITISVDTSVNPHKLKYEWERNGMTTNNDKAQVSEKTKGGVVRWTSPDGDFVVVFKDETPLNDFSFRGQKRAFVVGTVEVAARTLGYPYFAAVFYNGHVVHEDPEVIVDSNGVLPRPRKKAARKKPKAKK